ncbi:MAG: acyltransferase, partial [Sutterellaceae bacterium]|nr:acyltransferase [Sutterellaceae bacterium]
VGGIRTLYFLYRIGGRFLFAISLWPVVVFYWALLPNARRASMNYLLHAYRYGFLKTKPDQWTVLRHLFHFADTILDKVLSVAGHFTDNDLAVTGRETLLADDRGAVIVTTHTGCLELCQALTADPSRLYILTHTKHAEKFNSVLARINPSFVVNHLEVTQLSPAEAIALSDTVAKGGFLVIAGDRVPVASEAVTYTEFLGEKAPFPSGPALLAMLLQCPLWSMICTRNVKGAPQRYRLNFCKLWEPQPIGRAARQAYFQDVADRFAKELEVQLAQAPLDWFNFFDFWGQKPKSEGRSR